MEMETGTEMGTEMEMEINQSGLGRFFYAPKFCICLKYSFCKSWIIAQTSVIFLSLATLIL